MPTYLADDVGFSQKGSYFPRQFLKLAHPGTCLAASEDLHHTIHRPASHHPWTSIRTSEDLHHTIHGPASHHPWTSIRTSEDLHQSIGTCIKPSRDLHQTIRTCIRPSRPASLYHNLSGQLKKKAGEKSTQSAQSVE